MTPIRPAPTIRVLLFTSLLAACASETPPRRGDGAGGDGASEAGISDGGEGDARSRDATDGGNKDAGNSAGSSCALGCHGSSASPAPPLGLGGTSATSARGVGAHAKHLAASTWHAPLPCSACHLEPKTITAPGHIDTALPAEVAFSGLAKADSASPAWSGTTCAGTYCHGATLSGGSATSPQWTKVDGTQTQCTSCHGMPPTSGHTSTSAACAACHKGVVDSAQKIIAPSLHIDGKVTSVGSHAAGYGKAGVHGPDFLKDPTSCEACHGAQLTGGTAKSCDSCHSGWKTSCTFCHGGTLNTTGAPPHAVDGKTATTVPAVGRHTSHVVAGATHAAYSCSLCHTVPASALSPGHLGPSPAEVKFTGLAQGSSYSFSTYYCTNVYCHGNGKSTTTGGSALWTGSLGGGCSACHDDETDGNAMTLGSYHKKHIMEKGSKCSDCHGCVVSSSKQITSVGKHINGTKDVCEPTWNPTTRSCFPAGCHEESKGPW